jgi:hypothetical protein
MSASEYRDEVCRLAQNLARCGYAVLPCKFIKLPDGKVKKVPARPKRDGGRGYLDATKDPDEIAWLWRNWAGPLVGVRTGPTSNVVLLDVDVKHDEARAWFHTNRPRLPETRTFRSYSGGIHLHYLDAPGIRCSTEKPVLGIDVRGEGGLLIHWFAFGLPCLDHRPPQPWPEWLTTMIWPPKVELSPAMLRRIEAHPDRTIERILARLAGTREGGRNAELNKAAWAIGKRVQAGVLKRADAEARLEQAALTAGMKHAEDGIAGTIKSGLEAALT